MAKRTKKAPGPEHIELNSLFAAVNRKDRGWWDTLTEPQQKKFSFWLYKRYLSSVSGDPDLQRYYLRATNIYSNKRSSAISPSKHGKLLYLLLTLAAPGGFNPRHNFIQPMRMLASTRQDANAHARVLLDLYPSMKVDDINTWSEIITVPELQELMREHGMTDQQIARALRNTHSDLEEEDTLD